MSETTEKNFTYHEPTQDTAAQHEAIRSAGKRFAELIEDECPPSRETSLAMTKLEEAVMWANASIARNITANVKKEGTD